MPDGALLQDTVVKSPLLLARTVANPGNELSMGAL